MHIDEFARMVADRIDEMAAHRTQAQLAAEMGFPRANALSMIRHGKLSAPIGRVGAIARVLGIDPGHAFRVWARSHPEIDEAIVGIYGTIPTEEERSLLEDLRSGRAVVVRT